ncbi:MAG: hypothetical protein CMJ48_06510, partial [Planctomycetaceae bacterium]|nr:hypothetical protein [Planctomycetaceae bacterium]
MTIAARDSAEQPDTDEELTSKRDVIAAHEPRNIVVLAVHQIILRSAWVFKTETVIMPAFLDMIAGPGWLRGCLPMLNRFGQSVPPMFFAARLRNAKYKKRVLFMTSVSMGVPFVVMAVGWFASADKRAGWLPAAFLGVYSLFFMATGLNQLTFGTVQGKLIRPDRRGRLMSFSGVVGSVISIIAAWFLLRRWLDAGELGFAYIFAFTGLGMIVAGGAALGVVEPPDAADGRQRRPIDHLHSAWRVFRDDADFRRVGVVAISFISLQLLFPHFQALGRERLELKSDGFQLMLWVVAQNAAVGLLSLLSGTIADRFGNRLALRLQVFAASLTPLVAMAIVNGWLGDGRRLFWLTFCLLGLVPVTLKTLINYSLELAEPARHPRYVSTLSFCLFVPMLLAPGVGWLIDLFGFGAVFVA